MTVRPLSKHAPFVRKGEKKGTIHTKNNKNDLITILQATAHWADGKSGEVSRQNNSEAFRRLVLVVNVLIFICFKKLQRCFEGKKKSNFNN